MERSSGQESNVVISDMSLCTFHCSILHVPNCSYASGSSLAVAQFKYSTAWEVVLMIVGSISAVAHGAALPGVMIIFGSSVGTLARGPGVNSTMNDTVSQMDLDDQEYELQLQSAWYAALGGGAFLTSYVQVSAEWTVDDINNK